MLFLGKFCVNLQSTYTGEYGFPMSAVFKYLKKHSNSSLWKCDQEKFKTNLMDLATEKHEIKDFFQNLM